MDSGAAKTCLVTGATGFVGRPTVKELLSKGWRVISISHSSPSPIQHENLTHITMDLHNTDDVAGLFSDYRPSHLLHLAWEATPGKFWHSTNNFTWVSTSAHLLDQFVANGGEKAVLAGSCAEYKWENETLYEDVSPVDGDTYYAASKLAFKSLAGVIAKDIDLVWARIFFPYGPEEDSSKLISYIFREISANRQPSIQTPDRAVDFIHVNDVALAFEKLLSASENGTVNICSGISLLPHEVAIECARLLGRTELLGDLLTIVARTQTDVSICGNRKKLSVAMNGTKPVSLATGLRTYLSLDD